ncbi:hypothetical protein P154DRAFT_222968 [Amniculicola lignicola CBS 123094]|uniref:Uncharacterized protein n=1 Tax=Amniculicola lignicola CBS 123094 TaxID=1392246 RepID=A0A6A5WZV3_9PLEO|nr:hypothetical protein P154DRAFT_222968 [Amniculicola lignicola CBS 123094]
MGAARRRHPTRFNMLSLLHLDHRFCCLAFNSRLYSAKRDKTTIFWTNWGCCGIRSASNKLALLTLTALSGLCCAEQSMVVGRLQGDENAARAVHVGI